MCLTEDTVLFLSFLYNLHRENFSISTSVPKYNWISPGEVFASSWFRLAAVLPGSGNGQVVKIKVVGSSLPMFCLGSVSVT